MTQYAALLLRAVIAIFAGLLIAGGTITLAADRANLQRPTLLAANAGPRTLIVPQVSGQAYVFAKGILEDRGFAWHVSGSVKGYAGNTVVEQEPAAGTVVLDTGAPVVTLTLTKSRAYAELGAPENGAPYAGTAVRLPADPLARRRVVLPRLTPRVPVWPAAAPKAGAKRKAARSKTHSSASPKKHPTASRTS
jgi:hypothetical protein